MRKKHESTFANAEQEEDDDDDVGRLPVVTVQGMVTLVPHFRHSVKVKRKTFGSSVHTVLEKNISHENLHLSSDILTVLFILSRAALMFLMTGAGR